MTIASFIVLLFFIAGEPVINIGNCETAAAVFIIKCLDSDWVTSQ